MPPTPRACLRLRLPARFERLRRGSIPAVILPAQALMQIQKTTANGQEVAIRYHIGMSQPVKLSDASVLDARLCGRGHGTVEFWACLGRAVEKLLSAPQTIALSRSGALRPLSECLCTVDSREGRKRVTDFLETLPFPHYEAHPDKPRWFIRIDEDGTRTVDRFVNRKFRPISVRAKAQRAMKLRLGGRVSQSSVGKNQELTARR